MRENKTCKEWKTVYPKICYSHLKLNIEWKTTYIHVDGEKIVNSKTCNSHIRYLFVGFIINSH